MKTISVMRAWMRAATADEQIALAARIGSSRGMLYQYAGGHRQASAEMAGKIEAAAAEMYKASKGRLPLVYRTDVSAACRACQYASKCLGQRAVVSDFPIVTEKELTQ